MKTLALILLLLSPALAQNANFEAMFERPNIADKKAIWRRLSKPEQIEVRRQNFAWGIEYLELDNEKIAYLTRFSAKLPTITRDEAVEFEREALSLFTKKEGALLFGSIGPYKPCKEMFLVAKYNKVLPECYCHVGSSFNMQCDSQCTSGGCATQPDGCGFGWLWKCNGQCP